MVRAREVTATLFHRLLWFPTVWYVGATCQLTRTAVVSSSLACCWPICRVMSAILIHTPHAGNDHTTLHNRAKMMPLLQAARCICCHYLHCCKPTRACSFQRASQCTLRVCQHRPRTREYKGLYVYKSHIKCRYQRRATLPPLGKIYQREDESLDEHLCPARPMRASERSQG